MPRTTCEHCIHFHQDPINPPAGSGECAKGNGHWYPMAPHLCKQHEVKPDATHNP